MKTKIIEVNKVLEIINDYSNQMGNELTTRAKEYLEEQIEMCSTEIEME